MIAEQNAADVARYCEDVLRGEVVAGDLVKAAVGRYLSDLDRQGTKGFDYVHDEELASAVCDFFPAVLRHSIGSLAGRPFFLESWQKFIVWNLFGWIRPEDGTRRFRRAFVSVARKNGKSTFAAGIAIYMAALDVDPLTGRPEDVAQVFLSATKVDQADIIYGEIKRMIEQSPALAKRSKETLGAINFHMNKGRIKKLGSDKPFHGLNPHLCCLDELHNWTATHLDFYQSMMSGSGYRTQPLILSVTTAGDDKSYIWLDEWRYGARLAKQEIEDDAFFAISYELDKKDDPLDPKNWQKANPNLGVSVKQEYLEQQAKEANESPVKLNAFTRFYGNRLVNSADLVFDVLKWDKCEGELGDFAEADAIGAACDLGGQNDLAAWGVAARFKTDRPGVYRYEFLTRAYIAADTTRDLSAPPYVQFVRDGLLKVTKYPMKDLEDDLTDLCKKWKTDSVAYDPYNGQAFAESLERKGIRVFSCPQNYSQFNEPIQELHKIICDGRCTHDGNKLLRWCMTNAVGVKDRNERMMLAKKESAGKIDPLVAMLMALKVASKAKSKPVGSLCSF